MGIEDIQISEELETNAPSIKYSGNEGPKSPQEMEQMIMASLEEEYAKYVFEMQEQGLEPMSMQRFIEQAMAEGQMSKGPILPSDEDPINPFGPKPQGPVLPDRQMAAYGGIMGLDGRKQYGIGSFFQDFIKDPLESYFTGKTPQQIKNESQLRVDREEGIQRDVNEGFDIALQDLVKNSTVTDKGTGPKEGFFDTLFKGAENEKGVREGGITNAISKNILPIIGGIGAGLFTKNTESDTPGLPSDTTALQLDNLKKSANILNQKQGMAAGLNFLPTVASRKYTPAEMIETYAQAAANGGRIGFKTGLLVPEDEMTKKTNEMILQMHNGGADINTISTITEKDAAYINSIISSQNQKAEGGIMDLGGMEKDYRAEGGFVPIGKQEKADDVPARLSVNEFVFTADAVRNAGGGDIDQGAKVMENMMKHLEQGGQVSEESQGMQGARDMFATSQRLGDVI